MNKLTISQYGLSSEEISDLTSFLSRVATDLSRNHNDLAMVNQLYFRQVDFDNFLLLPNMSEIFTKMFTSRTWTVVYIGKSLVVPLH